ncbi:adenosine receptor A2b-like [Oculina patagonica]
METWFWILGWFLSILTMTGNGFVIFIVIRKRHLRTKTNAFIVSLAVADFCVGMSVVPSWFVCVVAGGCNSHGVFYKVMVFILDLLLYASALNLCSLVLDRYIAIVKPLKYLTFMKRRRVVQMISLSWAISVTFTVLVRSPRYISETSLVRNIVGWIYTVLELFSFVIVIFCFTSMLSVVCKHNRSARALGKQLRFNHRIFFKKPEKSAIKMMAVVICLFLVCYGIALRCNFVLIFSDHKSCNDAQYKLPIFVLNSAVNPLAYAIFKRDIKKEFKRLIYSVTLINKV